MDDTIQRALEIAGNRNRYQFILLSFLCCIFYFTIFPVLGSSFYYMDPIFKCKGSDDIVDEKNACPKLSQCTIINNYTIVSSLKLYCDRQGERDMIQAVLSVGSMLGLLFNNFFSDLKGKRTALIMVLVLGLIAILFTIIGAYTDTTFLLVLGSLLSGYSGYSLIILCYLMCADFCSANLRQIGVIYLNIAYSFGLITFFFMYNWLNQWQNVFFVFMLIPYCGLIAVACILTVESPSYLLKMHRKQQCIQNLKIIGYYNNKDQKTLASIDCIINAQNLTIEKQTFSKQTKALFSTLKDSRYLKIIILTALTEAGGNLFYFGIQFAIDDIGFNYGIDNLVLGTTQIITSLVITKFIVKMKRKRTIIICYFVTAGISFLNIIPFVKQSPYAGTAMVVCIRIFTTIAYFMIVMIQTQSFPLEISSIGAGMIEALSQVGSIIAPLVIAVSINLGLNKMASLGVITVFLTIFIIFIPQTSRKKTEEEEQSQDLKESLLLPS